MDTQIANRNAHVCGLGSGKHIEVVMYNKSEMIVPHVIAVCTSAGGVPKRPLPQAYVTVTGVRGDKHAHAKHDRPDRALSLFDMEILRQLIDEGFPLEPGMAGENITVEGLHVQTLREGTLLRIGDVLIRLETPRKPCYVLDSIDPQLKEAITGRCGYMASVIRSGIIRPGMNIQQVEGGSGAILPQCESRLHRALDERLAAGHLDHNYPQLARCISSAES